MGAVVDVDEALGRLEGIEEERGRIDGELNALDGRQADLDKQYERLNAKREALVASRDRADAEYTALYTALDELAPDPSGEIATGMPDPAAPHAIAPTLTQRASLSESKAFVPPIPPGSVWESGEVPALTEPVVQAMRAPEPAPKRWKLWAGIGGGVFVILMIIGAVVSSDEPASETDKAAAAAAGSGGDDSAAGLLGAVGDALSGDEATKPASEAPPKKKRRKKRARKKASAKKTSKKSSKRSSKKSSKKSSKRSSKKSSKKK